MMLSVPWVLVQLVLLQVLWELVKADRMEWIILGQRQMDSVLDQELINYILALGFPIHGWLMM